MSDAEAVIALLDEDGTELLLDALEVETLFAITDALDAATTSACPGCRCRVLACLAFADLLDLSPPHPRTEDLLEFADDAPTSHCYVQDLETRCRHGAWVDPGRREWEAVLLRLTLPPRVVR
ncbi:MAG: hypothetical protein WCI50_11245 [Actinomycetes bacterium]